MNSGEKTYRSIWMFAKYPFMLSYFVIGSSNLTSAAYTLLSMPRSSNRCSRSSAKKLDMRVKKSVGASSSSPRVAELDEVA